MAKKWWVLLVVCAGTFMLLLDVTIVVVALPDIQSGLHSTFADVQWVVDAYALTLASLLLTAGILADRYGRRLLFVIGLVIFTGGSLLCGLAQSPLMLILSRALQGVGGAILFATSLALLAQTFRGRERGVAFGVWGAITGISTALGPILGGLITSGISWRGIFLVNIPIGIAAIAIALWQLEESKRPEATRPDWAGFVTLTAGLVGLVYGLIRAGEITWSDSGVVVSLVLGAGFLLAFVVVELRGEHPMFDLSLFRIPTFLGGSVAAFTMNGSLFAMLVYIVLYLQDDLGYSALGAGVRVAIISAAMFVSATISGRLSSHVPVRWLIGPGLFLVGIGLLVMTGVDAATTWTHLVPGFILGGIGAGMVNPPLASTAVGVVTPDRSGMASGVNTTFRQIGIAVAIATYGSIFTASLQRGLTSALASQPGLASKTPALVSELKQGAVQPVIASTPPSLRIPLANGIHTAFAGAMNDIFYVSGALALVGAVCSAMLIRSRDFVATHAPSPEPGLASEPLTNVSDVAI